MLLGHKLPAPYSSWRVVERDLYDVSGRVREYDEDARLVREDESGQLGLGVHIRRHGVPGPLVLARPMHDLDTDLPLEGEPDGRVIHFMRATDSRRFHDIRTWQRMVKDAGDKRAYKAAMSSEESFTEKAEQYVHAYGRDIGATKRAFFPDRERAVA